MQPIRLGVVGCGVIGSRHVADAARCREHEVVAVADPRQERARAIGGEHGVPHCFAEGRDLIACDAVEAVVLAVPTGARRPLAEQALAARKHVLLEKPAGMNAQEVRELMALRGDCVVAGCSSRFRTSSRPAPSPTASCAARWGRSASSARGRSSRRRRRPPRLPRPGGRAAPSMAAACWSTSASTIWTT